MHDFLKADRRNIVVVHCNAGKGRTGTSIASFLMYGGLSANATDAINYYGWKRFSTGKGVTQPCQLRYIHYFEAVYKKKVRGSLPKILECLIITTIPKISQNGCKPYIDILNGDYRAIYTTKNSIQLRKYKAGPKELEERNVIKIVPEKKNLVLSGDVHFMIKHKGSFNNTNICRFSINTGFGSNKVTIPKDQISPDSVAVSKKFHKKFKVTLVFKDYCDVGAQVSENKHLNMSDLCQRGKLKNMKTTKEWDRIEEILDEHEPYPNQEAGEQMLFYEDVDYYQVVNKKLAISGEKYNMVKENGKDDLPKNISEQDQDSKEEEEKDFNIHIVASKEDRNTMWADRRILEKKENNDLFHSVNEFKSDEKKSTLKSKF